jgi:hypothetical protein
VKNIVFFIRAFNDIDHFTPLIYRVSQSPDCHIDVFCIDPKIDYRNNINIQFLSKKCDIVVKYLYEEFSRDTFGKKVWKSVLKISRILKEYRFSSFGKELIIRIYQFSGKRLIKQQRDTPNFAEYFIEKIKPDCLIFDWVNPEAFGVTSVLLKAKTLEIPSFSLPHGVNLFTNFDTYQGSNNVEKRIDYFDYTISQGELSRKHLENEGIPSDKIVDLGSLRFCREWMDFSLENIVSTNFDSPCNKNKLKLVFFLTKLKYNIDRQLILETIEMLARDPDIYLIVKPHTRGMSTGFLKDLQNKYQIDIREDDSSVLLSKWADVGMVIGSSIGLQILHDGKLLLYLDYLDSNQSVYDKVGACWKIESSDSLKDAIIKLKQDKTYRPYSSESIQKIFEDVVYAGDSSRNVIEDYFNFIINRRKDFYEN